MSAGCPIPLFLFVAVFPVFRVVVFLAPDLGVGAPRVELPAGRQRDLAALTGTEIGWGRRAELRPVRQVDFDADTRQGFVGHVRDSAAERVVLGVVRENQACPAAQLPWCTTPLRAESLP